MEEQASSDPSKCRTAESTHETLRAAGLVLRQQRWSAGVLVSWGRWRNPSRAVFDQHRPHLLEAPQTSRADGLPNDLVTGTFARIVSGRVA